MLDVIFAIFSMALLIAFMSVVLWYIALPNLTIIVVLVLLMGIYDFWRELRTSRKD